MSQPMAPSTEATVTTDATDATEATVTTDATVTTASARLAPATAIRGDGTTGASRIRARLRSWRWPAAGLVAILLAGAVLVSLGTKQSTVPFAPDNPSPAGAMALAQVLEKQGVDIVYATSVAEAIGASGPGSTLLVANDYGMPDDVARSLLDTGSAVVLVAPGPALLAAATSQVSHAGVAPDGATTTAQCTDPDAEAAGEITSSGAGFRLGDSGASSPATLCFLSTTTGTPVGHYAVFELATDAGDGSGDAATGPLVRALDDDTPLTNASITDAGNAALGLRMLGHEARLVWLLPERPAAGAEAGGLAGLLPPWTAAVGAQLLLLALVTALWRGRRLGPLATEDLPVVVQASETTRGRGRLYRRSRAHGHAGAALRARAADRMAVRLGVPRSAGADAVVDAVARASHRPAQQVGALLYGPPPAGDVELTRLATDLDQLESEVHRA
ncbi:protein of unknown function [Sanguibacter gelidistatuariae]|uniref:DUF4350 domain-containing protein n=1 Tax=Sanguibacter gelidistatuariae TaxID=1814289 RepID=A0A1G6VUH4_9MICO|nr:DUF4350 domain-containing protein [Sanguibacter gelidistatuariae]SDD57063.1 protein of unknown function [Sanguibacter gelidistatuariae]